MRLSIILGVLMSVMLMSCSKTNDQTTPWVGVYTGSAGSTFTRVLVTKVNDNTVKMELDATYLGAFIPYATLQKVAVNSAITSTINEDGQLIGSDTTYHYQGTAGLSGSTLTISGTYTNTVSNVSRPYYFSGSK